MRAHPTKNKGDIGLLHAQVDLAEKGFGVCIPLTEHEAFDLVAYQGSTFYRVQVKYRAVVDGALHVHFRTSWADRHGSHNVPMNKDEVDVLCIYSPDTRQCYYVAPKKFRRSVRLRVTPAKNGQKKGIYDAADFTEFPPAP